MERRPAPSLRRRVLERCASASAAALDTPRSSRQARGTGPCSCGFGESLAAKERSKGHVHITPRFCVTGLHASLSRDAEPSVMSGARACLGRSSALARFAAQPHARRVPARRAHQRDRSRSRLTLHPRSPSSRVLPPRSPTPLKFALPRATAREKNALLGARPTRDLEENLAVSSRSLSNYVDSLER